MNRSQFIKKASIVGAASLLLPKFSFGNTSIPKTEIQSNKKSGYVPLGFLSVLDWEAGESFSGDFQNFAPVLDGINYANVARANDKEGWMDLNIKKDGRIDFNLGKYVFYEHSFIDIGKGEIDGRIIYNDNDEVLEIIYDREKVIYEYKFAPDAEAMEFKKELEQKMGVKMDHTFFLPLKRVYRKFKYVYLGNDPKFADYKPKN